MKSMRETTERLNTEETIKNINALLEIDLEEIQGLEQAEGENKIKFWNNVE